MYKKLQLYYTHTTTITFQIVIRFHTLDRIVSRTNKALWRIKNILIEVMVDRALQNHLYQVTSQHTTTVFCDNVRSHRRKNDSVPVDNVPIF